MITEEMIEKSYNFLADRFIIQSTSNFSGGEHRAFSGDTVEMFMDVAWDLVVSQYPDLKTEIRRQDDKIKFYYGEGKDDYISEGVDRHCYINDKLVLAVECKTYLDKCYMQRADSDFHWIKKSSDDITSCIISIENGIGDRAYNFFMTYEECNIDNCFFFADKKRNSNVKIYNTWEERLNKGKIKTFLIFLDNICLKNR